ncbi:hypothetical protein MBLNU13_g03798t1 [Cladosporium sp. NU13]
MTSGNAFRDGAHAQLLATNAAANGDTTHAHKRRKLLPSPPQASIFTKTGDDRVTLEVDHMILDYLSYEATKAVLASRTSSNMHSPSLENKLAMVDTFLEMFKARHPSYVPDAELRFRLLLLKFATLYCSRFDRATVLPSHHALHGLRENNTARAMAWIQNADRMPSGKYDLSGFESGPSPDHSNVDADTTLRQNDIVESWRNDARHKTTTTPRQQAYLESRRAYTLKVLKRPTEDDIHEDAFYGTSACLSLLDLLPSFMGVIAARNELNNSNLSTGLMELAAQFMLQASLEQYLACGATGCDAIDEAFAWGLKPTQPAKSHKQANPTAQGDGDDTADLLSEVDRMFQNEDNNPQENPEWHDIKGSHIAELAHSDSETLRQHLEDVAYGYPIAEFEETVLQLLAGLAASLPEPVFSQLEKGTLDGMSRAETQGFLRDDCGLGAHWPAVPN